MTTGSPPACPAHDDRKLYPGRARPQAAYTVDADGLWTINGYHEARQILRSTKVLMGARHTEAGTPPLFAVYRLMDTTLHHHVKRQISAFFVPSVLAERYSPMIEASTDEQLGILVRRGRADLAKIVAAVAGELTATLVGLTDSLIPGRRRRSKSRPTSWVSLAC